jgi:hypothetical protein
MSEKWWGTVVPLPAHQSQKCDHSAVKVTGASSVSFSHRRGLYNPPGKVMKRQLQSLWHCGLKSSKLAKLSRWYQGTTYSVAIVERFERQHPRGYNYVLQSFEGDQTSGRSWAINSLKIAKIDRWGYCGWTGRAMRKRRKEEALVGSWTLYWGYGPQVPQVDARRNWYWDFKQGDKMRTLWAQIWSDLSHLKVRRMP